MDRREGEFGRRNAAARAAVSSGRCSDDRDRASRPSDVSRGSESNLGWSCETAERALSRLSRETDSRARLPNALAAHLADCEACRREEREGGLSARLLGRVASERTGTERAGTDRAGNGRPTDPLFLRGVLAAVQEERPPVRRLEALQRAQWRAGLVAIAVLAVALPWLVISLPDGSASDPMQFGVEVTGSDPAALDSGILETGILDGAPAGPSRELTLGDLASSVAAHESATLFHADRYLAPDADPYERCRFIPSGTEVPGADTEVQF